MKKKIAFVVQRYGLEVNGGAELCCRQMVEHLADQYDIEVLTTKAIDYITWKDEYRNEIDTVNGITVRRFGVDKPRNNNKFNKLSGRVIGVPHTEELEEQWIDEQGPLCPSLIQYIEDHESDYDLFAFMTYLYYTTARGLPKVAKKAIVIPTAHDEPPIYLDYYNKVFKEPAGLFYCTEDEMEFVERKFHNSNVPNNKGLGGVGVEIPDNIDPVTFKKDRNLDQYMVYAGRIDESKGCKQLFEYYLRYKENNNNNLKLVMMGKPVMDIPQSDDIISLGFVSDQDKFNIMAGADFLIMPSQFESLSMVVLEAMTLSVPVVVNGRCNVLRSHCIKGDAGLYYKSYYEFEGCMNYMITHEKERLLMGKNGVKYVDMNYRWDIIVKRFVDLVDRILDK